MHPTVLRLPGKLMLDDAPAALAVLAQALRDEAGPRPYAAGTWGPAAASALVARDGYAWSEEQ